VAFISPKSGTQFKKDALASGRESDKYFQREIHCTFFDTSIRIRSIVMQKILSVFRLA